MSSSPTSILLIDDHTLFLQGLRALLRGAPEYTVIGEANDAPSGIALAATLHPDLILLDLHLPGSRGLDSARRILALAPAPRVMILTGASDMDFVPEAVQLGVMGFLRKDAPSTELIHALNCLRENKTYLCSEASAAVFHSIRNPGVEAKNTGLDPSLSVRETQVLTFMAKGLRNKEIADQIGTSIKSVETYRSRLMTKLKVSSTAELLRYALTHGL